VIFLWKENGSLLLLLRKTRAGVSDHRGTMTVTVAQRDSLLSSSPYHA
jgi:hypothetical protein